LKMAGSNSNSDENEELEEDYYTFLNLPRNVSNKIFMMLL